MESLALLVSLIILGRIAHVTLCVALVVAWLHHRYVDGLLQARPGLPESPWFACGACIAVLGMALHLLSLLP